MKLSTTLAITGAAGAIATAGLASPAQAATASAPKPKACSVKRLDVALAHPYVIGHKLDQPVSFTAKGKKTCVLRGSATVRLLDKKGKVIGYYRYVAGKKGRTTLVGPGRQAVFHLTFGQGGKAPAHPAKLRVTLPNHGGSKAIAWGKTPIPTSKNIVVDGITPWED